MLELSALFNQSFSFESGVEVGRTHVESNAQGAHFVERTGDAPHAVTHDVDKAHGSLFAVTANVQNTHLAAVGTTRDVQHRNLCAVNLARHVHGGGHLHVRFLGSVQGGSHLHTRFLGGVQSSGYLHVRLSCDVRRGGNLGMGFLGHVQGRRNLGLGFTGVVDSGGNLHAVQGIASHVHGSRDLHARRIFLGHVDHGRHLDSIKGTRIVHDARNLRPFVMLLRAVEHRRKLQAMHLFAGDVCKDADLRTQHIAVGTGHEQAHLQALAGFAVLVHQVEGHPEFSVVVQGIQGTGGSIAGGAVPATGDFAPEGSLFGYDGTELFLRELCAVVILQGDARLLVFGRPFQANTVLTRGKPQVDGSARLLVKFRHKFTSFVTNEQPSFHIVADVQARVHAPQIRHHHITRAG